MSESPWSNDAEQAVLGAMLLDGDAITQASAILDDTMFYRDAHRLLFARMQALAATGSAVDPVTLQASLNGDLDKIGGMEYLGTLIDVVPTAGHLESHAQIVRDHATRRRLIGAATTLIADAYGRVPVADLVAQVGVLAAYTGSTHEPVDGLTRARTLRAVMEHPENLTPPRVVVPGLAWQGRITLMSAREGVGKSTLIGAGAAAATTGGEFLGERCLHGPVVWVLIEEALSDLTIRAVRFQTDLDRLHILERPARPLASLVAEVERVNPVLAVVDTLHRFASAERQAAHAQTTDAGKSDAWAPIMAALDQIAHVRGHAVLLSAQAVKATGEYRDSSEIGHGVDFVCNLVRPDKDSPVRRLEWAKARGLTLETITLELRGDTYVRGGVVQKRLTKGRQKVLDVLEPPMTFTEWEQAADIPDTSFKRAVKYLCDHGYAAKGADDTYGWGHKGQIGANGPTGPTSPEGPTNPRTVSASGGPLDQVEDRYGI